MMLRLILAWLLLSGSLLADTHRWIGGAAATTDQYTITVGGTWAGSDTFTITDGNGHAAILTIGTGTTNENVAQAIANMISASTVDGNLQSDETRTIGCQSVREFAEMTATADGAVVTIKAKTVGTPVTFTVSETATSGTATKATVISATGPHFLDNADNWHNGTLPADGDSIEFVSGSVDCRYGLGYLIDNDPNSTIACDVVVSTDYEGDIGLPYHNPSGYVEYRQRRLKHGQLTGIGSKTLTYIAGSEGGKGGKTRILLHKSDVLMLDGGEPSGTPNHELAGGTAVSLELVSGAVIVEPRYDPATSPMQIDDIDFGIRGGRDNRLRVWMQGSPTFLAHDAMIRSGVVKWQTGVSNLTFTLLGGDITFAAGVDIPAMVATTIKKGKVNFRGIAAADLAGAIDVWTGGTFSLEGTTGAITASGGITQHGGSTVNLNGQALSITYDGCEETDATTIP